MVTRNSSVHFKKRQLNGQRQAKEGHGEKMLTCYISPVEMKPIHMKNEI